jgi:glycosyltransferase involved in cell wall biosynthesis
MLTWADAIYVFDSGSVDDTWEIVQEIASRDTRVKPIKKDHVYFSENLLRGWMFHQARDNMKTGDWFLRVDADEFHHIPPPEFVKTRLKSNETIVYHQYYNFALLQSEVADWEAGKESLADRSKPIESRRKWFLPSVYSEPRLCRYRDTMQWPKEVSFPYNAGYLARERIPIRHYPHRDPVQLKQRSILRTYMIGLAGDQLFTGYSREDVIRLRDLVEGNKNEEINNDWRKFIVSDETPGLRCWTPDTMLTEVHYLNHIPAINKRLAQWILHSYGLPILDRMRSKWNAESYPQKIPESVTKELAEKLAE